MVSKTIHSLGLLGLAAALSMTLGGCTPGSKSEETEGVLTQPVGDSAYILETESETNSVTGSISDFNSELETEYITQFGAGYETETQTSKAETQAETEPETQRKWVAQDIQQYITTGDYSGTAEYEAFGNKDLSGTFSFEANSTAFSAVFDDSDALFYAGTDGAVYFDGSRWGECGDDFADLMELVFNEECELSDSAVLIGGVGCYRLYLTYEDDVSIIDSALRAMGLDNAITGPASFIFYVSSDTFEVVRIDISAEYQAGSGNTLQDGEFSCVLSCSEAFNIDLAMPETEEQELNDYTAGSVLDADNMYYNNYFDLQIAGRDLVEFSKSETQILSDSYIQSGSSYTEEAYAAGENAIVNVSSIQIASGVSTYDVLQKYLSDSEAIDAESSYDVNVGDNTYLTQTAEINQTLTKTYCTVVGKRALIITLYYNDDNMVTQFENNLFTIAENAMWSAASWTLENKYIITTPRSYVINNENSSDIYVCMVNDDTEVNVFALTGRTIQSEVEEEAYSVDGIAREAVVNEDITIADGIEMRYLVVHNTDTSQNEETEYYTYLGLVQEDGAVIEFYIASVDADLDFRSIYTEFGNCISISENSTDSSSSDGASATDIDYENIADEYGAEANDETVNEYYDEYAVYEVDPYASAGIVWGAADDYDDYSDEGYDGDYADEWYDDGYSDEGYDDSYQDEWYDAEDAFEEYYEEEPGAGN